VAHRFLCSPADYASFRDFWLQQNLDISLEDLLNAIVATLGNEVRLMVVVDEPGLAWDGTASQQGTSDKAARDIVEATSQTRKCDGGRDNRIRWVFTSLIPVFTQDELNDWTITGGPVEFVELQLAGDVNQASVESLIDRHLSASIVATKMDPSTLKRCRKLILAVSNGHWRTMELMIGAAAETLPRLYPDNIRDIVVSVGASIKPPSALLNVDENATIAYLLACSVLNKKLKPSDCPLGGSLSLAQLSKLAFVLNSICTDANGGFVPFVPVVSLLVARLLLKRSWTGGGDWDPGKWGPFVDALKIVLQSAGHVIDLTGPPEKVELAFEVVWAHVLKLNGRAWSPVQWHNQTDANSQQHQEPGPPVFRESSLPCACPTNFLASWCLWYDAPDRPTCGP
jgi:hypothetical protein